MTCSNDSTRNKVVWVLCVGLASVLTGCGSHSTRAVPALQGHADLDALVHLHPGWAGVAQYDLALTRLRKASLRLDRPRRDTRLAVLTTDDAQPPPSSAALLQGEGRQLETIRQAQIARVRERRSLARQRQIASLTDVWQGEADAEYARQARRAQGEYLRRVRQTLATDDLQRLNLSLQIKALQNIVSGWKSSTPPTPRLTEARADLAQKLSLLASLEAERSVALTAASAARRKEIAQASAARGASVRLLKQQKEADLLRQDEQQTREFARGLVRQEQALLQSQSAQSAIMVESVGSLGADALPPVRSTPALSAGSTAKSLRQLQMAQTRLVAQRARWVSFIYDDTRAAALDAAQKRHWVVSFAKSGPGTALTAPLAQILSRRGWKT